MTFARNHPHDRRQEGDAPVDDLPIALQQAVLALHSGSLHFWQGGYVRHDHHGHPLPPKFSRLAINGMLGLALVKREDGKVTPTGTGAWFARTLARRRDANAERIKAALLSHQHQTRGYL